MPRKTGAFLITEYLKLNLNRKINSQTGDRGL